MRDYTIRPWTPADRPALRTLWQTAFGDGEALIDSFFDAFMREGGDCVIAETDGRLVSAMYVLPGFTLLPYRDRQLTASYTYALATLPEYRGRGVGSAVYRAAHEAALAQSEVSCVLPAELSLYPFYENAAGVSPLGGVREALLTREELSDVQPMSAVRFPGYRYAAIREQLLSHLPHAVCPEEMYDFLEENGMEFFLMENGLAAAETSGGVCRVRELILPEGDALIAAAGVARWCRAERYEIRTPLFFGGPGSERPLMLAGFRSQPDFPVSGDFWWGLGMD